MSKNEFLRRVLTILRDAYRASIERGVPVGDRAWFDQAHEVLEAAGEISTNGIHDEHTTEGGDDDESNLHP